MKSLPEGERRAFGKEVNDALTELETAIEAKVADLGAAPANEAAPVDVTLPTRRSAKGGLHVLTVVRRDIEGIFRSMGFSVATGPEAEDARHNFDALNIPENHPARDLWDTFWLESKEGRHTPGSLLMRTHTSPVQVRYMEENHPPFRIVAPGEVYRYEATDASHEFQFGQIEGLMVDRRDATNPVTMHTLLSVLTKFFEAYFKKTIALRVRPSYFPFVEPGIEVDMSCVLCDAKGCSLCSQTGWLEMLGAGMVHPNVFKAIGYNPEELQGFAFGFGIDRLANLKYGVPDVRLYRSGDLKFLEQFRT
jgi:phenylalanyl-tRNA synthetase alpha chain